MLAAEVERIRPASVAAMGGRAQPVLVTVVGDVSPRAALALLDKVFGGVTAVSAQGLASAPEPLDRDVRVRFPGPAAQAQLGYVVAAPPPGSKDALAWQLALYVLTHGYEGRLGLEAINRRGLVYYIDGEYQSDGDAAWIRITTGADAEKLAATEAVLREELRNLRERPPGEDEIAEARRHLLGRERTAAQSNAEIAAALSRQWLWRGRLREPGELARDLAAVTVADVHRILPALTAGITIIVEVSE
jgi:predicted Zn-dependent peptidase